MAVLVGAAVEHPYRVTIIVPVDTGSARLADISSMLDRSGLSRGEHWSLDADVKDESIHLRFAFSSKEFAGLLKSAIGEPERQEPLAPKQTSTPLKAASLGPASGRFLSFVVLKYTPQPKESSLER